MVFTRKKSQSSKRLLSHLVDFDQDNVIGNTVSDRQEDTPVNEGTTDQEFTVGNSDGDPAFGGTVVNVNTSERYFIEEDDREVGSFDEMVKDRIENAILTAIDDIVTPK